MSDTIIKQLKDDKEYYGGIGKNYLSNSDIGALLSNPKEFGVQKDDNINFAKSLKSLGCKVIMPWGSQIGSGRGLENPEKLLRIREEMPDLTLIIDAGIGRISHVCEAFEIGYDGILLNTAISKAEYPEEFAKALSLSMEAVKRSIKSGLIPRRNFATPSTTTIGIPFKK